MAAPRNALDELQLTPQLAAALEYATAAINRLDARVSVSPVAKPWRQRAAWTGYARALQLQGTEIDEIEVFSWGCGVELHGRRHRSSIADEFGALGPWRVRLNQPSSASWRDSFPFTPQAPADRTSWPSILNAIELLRQAVRDDSSVGAWLWLPLLLKGHGVSETPLPCLIEGTRAFRLRATPTLDEWRAVLRAIGKAALLGLERLDQLESHHRQAAIAVRNERRPGALPVLLALSASQPLLSPQGVADRLGLSLPGAGKLLSRATALGLLVEISGRMAWRRYLVPDLAIAFGYLAAPRGRPPKELVPNPTDRGLAKIFDTFDEEMRRLDQKLATWGISSDTP